LYIIRTQNTHKHPCLCGIRTHDPSVGVGEDSTQAVLDETAGMRYLAADFHINRTSITKTIGIAVSCNNATSVRFIGRSRRLIATGYGAGLTMGGLSSNPGEAKFSLLHVIRSALGATQPRMQLVTRALSPEVNRLGRKADHSLPTSAEITNMWIYVYIHSPVRLYGAELI
jgi:hypothetical protein